jgi:hypothetical protein
LHFGYQGEQLSGVVWTAMGTSVFRIRTAVDFPPVLKSDHTMRSCRAGLASMPGGPIHLSGAAFTDSRQNPDSPAGFPGPAINKGRGLSSRTPTDRAHFLGDRRCSWPVPSQEMQL